MFAMTMPSTYKLNTGSLMPLISDTAAVYKNEGNIGKALKILLPKHGLTREDIFITSKLGKLKAIGISNYTMKHMNELLLQCNIKPAVLQIEYHPYLVQTELVDLCKQHNIHFQAYSSLGTTGNDKLLTDPVIKSVADRYSKTPAQVLLRWSVQQNIGVIPKSTNPDHIRENISISDFELTEEEIGQLSGLNKNKHFTWNPEKIT
ncbi:hypothetical protein LSH36_776g02440 [Paralvinella palmiformis]|uniref:NADP-dependent oxidoreductase domain-containing protein n=1 Tax=Paralvinella palmiformis TaxID=53620 RepID=A0AAD9MUF2_9ANNE|nr:hypothetical protein LSH36_776g02440 [Paralvinella palmiformis]